MQFKSLKRNPVFIIGILLLVIFLFNYARHTKLLDRSEKLYPSACSVVLAALSKNMPATWKGECDQNHLIVRISSDITEDKEETERPRLYQELAKNLVFISQNSPKDNLTLTKYVTVQTIGQFMTVEGQTFGRYVTPLADFKHPNLLKEHLKTSIKTKEYIK